MEENLLAGGGETRRHTGGVALGDAGLKGPVGIVLPQPLGVDAAHQVAVHIADGLVLRHHLVQGQAEPVSETLLIFLAALILFIEVWTVFLCSFK